MIGVLIQARMSSARLPGKVLRPLAGRPMLDWLLERLMHAQFVDRIVVTTSIDPSDDPVAEHCRQVDAAVYRGPLEDVASRVFHAARRHSLDAFVRISGDSPFLDQRLVDHAVELHRSQKAEVVTNVRPRSFPAGQSVELLTTDTVGRALGLMGGQADREHVTPAIYRHAHMFNIVSFSAAADHSWVDLAVDTEAEAERAERLLATMDRPHWLYDWEEMAALAGTA